MDKRLKLYREQNVNESGNSVQDFFIKVIGEDNVKVAQCDTHEQQMLAELQ